MASEVCKASPTGLRCWTLRWLSRHRKRLFWAAPSPVCPAPLSSTGFKNRSREFLFSLLLGWFLFFFLRAFHCVPRTRLFTSIKRTMCLSRKSGEGDLWLSWQGICCSWLGAAILVMLNEMPLFSTSLPTLEAKYCMQNWRAAYEGAGLRREGAANREDREEKRNKRSAPGPGVSCRELQLPPAARCVWQIHPTSPVPQLTCNETNWNTC